MALDPITAALEAGKSIMDKIWPDAGEAERNKVNIILTTFAAQAQIVSDEAKSEHWIVAAWRPIMMLTFGWLIVSRWYGWAAPNLSEAEYLKLWDIIEMGLGGYVIGRSAEKIAPSLSNLFKR